MTELEERIADLQYMVDRLSPFIGKQVAALNKDSTPLERLVALTNNATLEKKRRKLAGVLKAKEALGRRVRCDYMYDIFDSTGETDEAARRMVGVCGTVESIDDAGQLHVKWDNGSTLALNPECDEFTILNDKQGFSNAVKRIQQIGFTHREDSVSFEEFLHSEGGINGD